jgi:hypothetical protein
MDMTKIAQCACEVCHKIIPRTEAVETYITEKSGHSGFSASSKVSDITSFNLQNFRINSGRNYYRKRKIWVCNSCWAGYNKFMEERKRSKNTFYFILFILTVISLAVILSGCSTTTIIEQDPKYARAPIRVPKYLTNDPDIKAIVLPVPRGSTPSKDGWQGAKQTVDTDTESLYHDDMDEE